MPALEQNFIDKWDAINRTAQALTENGLSFVAAQRLHHTKTLQPEVTHLR